LLTPHRDIWYTSAINKNARGGMDVTVKEAFINGIPGVFYIPPP
jgi:hypothetical protein